MRLHHLATVTLVTAIAFSAAGCGSSGSDPTPTSSDSAADEPVASSAIPDLQASLIGSWKDDPTGAYLTFSDDGTFIGSDNCNNLSGSFSPSGEDRTTLRFDMHTLRGCSVILDWLDKTREVSVEGDRMTAFDDAGDVLGTLERG
ncbi:MULTISPECIES: META domain-containing protein [unclassified Pseudoclavibacter]|uniref:META domain-containing protein n=1 Tax=unclassified Pseudoclavibacter TaxID=2615177 RepID=UPI0013011DC6|nr:MULTISPECIES: META domain-containing protein [unclassified Pseudoclavibacter]KAB1647146.1 META domain-containing protein [Pseudoclavibacter sp. CFCC 14310]KAB1662889.1 META domain-containing protein [Pseudoclavibacter sp. CFCC 13611]